MQAMRTTIVAMAFVATAGQAQATDVPCPRQPPPPAIDSAGALPVGDHSTAAEFAATPSLEYPRRAWVVRLYWRAAATSVAQLEIVRLRLQDACNRYDIEKRWATPVGQDEFGDMIDAITPHARIQRPSEVLVLDGTPLDLRVRVPGARVTRSLNHYAQDGTALSAVFHDIVAKHVPASDLPTADWRTPH